MLRPLRYRAVPAVLSLIASSLVFLATPAHAHGASAGDLPLTPETLQLKARRPAEIIALFAREQLPVPTRGAAPRSARAGGGECLLPPGVDAVLRGPDGDSLTLVGREDRLQQMVQCIDEIDVPVTAAGPDRARVVVTLRHASARQVLRTALRLPDAGSAAAAGPNVTLVGKPSWLHRALRGIIRAELGLDDGEAPLTP